MMWLLQLPAPIPVQPAAPTVATVAAAVWDSKDWVLVIGSVFSGLLALLASWRAGRAEARASAAETAAVRADTTCAVTHEAVADARATIEASANHIAKIESNTDGRLTLMQIAIDAQMEEKRQLVAKLEAIALERLLVTTAEKDALTRRLAAAEADVLRRADAAPAVPPVPRAVRKDDGP